MKETSLVPIAFRLPAPIVEFIRKAAKRERISQARFLQECVTRHGKAVAADPFGRSAKTVGARGQKAVAS